MTTILRPYQLEAVTAIRRHAARGGKGVILKMPTGAGKTACFSDFLIGAHKKERFAIMAVKGKSLVHQASERLKREGVPHGIYQGDNTRGSHHRILLCSIDTLYARQLAPKADLIVIDEVHLSHSDSFYWFLDQYPNTFKIGVSATPNHKKGMQHVADIMINPIPIKDLIEQGYLVGGKYFVPYIPDLRSVGKANGDFKSGELGEASSKDAALTMNAAKVWRENLQGKSTFVYAVNVAHAGVLATALELEGARVRVITGSTKDATRRICFEEIERGDIDCIVSVGVLTTGVDIPSLRAILCCRPTESYNLWVQILGRGTRIYPGKDSFLVYDLSGNLLKHGPIEIERESFLEEEGAVKRSVPSERMIICEACYATFIFQGETNCIACGELLNHLNKRDTGKRRFGLGDNSEVIEYKIHPWEADLQKWCDEAKIKGHKKGWIFHMVKSKYGEDIANEAWPRVRSLRKWPVKAKIEFNSAALTKGIANLDEAIEMAKIEGRM